MLQPGTILDNYEVRSHIAGGVTGEVYRARHRVLKSDHAIKVLDDDLAGDEAFRSRFLDAVPPPVLRHPHIVPVTNILVEPDLLALVMDLVEGPSLATVMEGERLGPWTLQDTLTVMSPVLGAMAYAHAQGLIHRDLRPEHVVLEQGEGGAWKPRITAFGGIGIAARAARRTRADEGGGNPAAFAAPEQAATEVAAGAAADVYALGMMLWRLLAGWIPSNPALDPLPGAPAGVVAALRQALSSDPAARQPDARALLKELTRAAAAGSPAGQAMPAPGPAPVAPAPRAPKPRETVPEAFPPPGFAPPPAVPPSAAPAPAVPPSAPQGPTPVSAPRAAEKRRSPVLLLVGVLVGLGVLALLGIGVGALLLLREGNGDPGGESSSDAGVVEDDAPRAAELTTAARDGLEAYKTRNVDGRDRALADALEALRLHDSAGSRGTAALLQVYDRKLSSSNVARCEQSAPGLLELDRVTRDVVAADEVTDEGHFARALWAFRHCQCNSGETLSSIPSSCGEASERFEQAYAAISGAPERNWFRFEVIWQWQMHELIVGNIYRKAGDERRGKQILQASLDLCARGEGYKDDAPVNDVELYKNCARAAIPLEMWDEMSRYNVRLADFEPGENGRYRAGPLSALSRLASHRDEACHEIPCYGEPTFETKDTTTWLNGYPKPRRGHDAHHFCIGWAYAQLGCYDKARSELDDYLDTGHATHRSEARALSSEIRGEREACRVPGI